MHSSRIPSSRLSGMAAATLAPWIKSWVAAGERDFLIVPFFVSPQGAIGSALRSELAALQNEVGAFAAEFTDGLSVDALAHILCERIRDLCAEKNLSRPSVVIVDHGGPSIASARLRDLVAGSVWSRLGRDFGPVHAASMESPQGDAFAFNRPLLADLLSDEGFASGDVVIAPLF